MITTLSRLRTAPRTCLLATLALSSALLHGQTQSSIVFYGASSKLEYVSDSEGNRIPDFSNAGYRGADAQLPGITRVITTIPAGASLATINSAIANASVSATNPGVIQLSAGTYTISGTILINKPGLVLRGAGDGRSGGSATVIRQTNTGAGIITIDVNGGTDDSFSSEVAGSRSNITTQRVTVGSRTFDVANGSLYTVGDNIIITHPKDARWINAVDPQNHWDAYVGNLSDIRYHRYITAISGNTLTVDAPVFNTLDRVLAQSFVYKYNRTNTLREVGVENLRVEAATGNTDSIRFAGVENCWIRGVTVQNFYRAGVLFTNASTRSTAFDCRAIDPSGVAAGGSWYNFCVEEAQLILFQNCYTRTSRHAFVGNGKALDSGIVVLDCTMDNPVTSAEFHRYWGQGMLFDRCRTVNRGTSDIIRLYNRGTSGSNHGWSAAHSVIWASDAGGGDFTVMKPMTAQNYAIGSLNARVDGNGINGGTGSIGYVEHTGVTDLSPSSLYLAQLADRRTPVAPNFTFATTTGSRTVVQGASATYSLNISQLTNLSGPVAFSIAGLPTGATGSFSPSSLSAAGSTTLSVTSSTITPAGTYTLTATGTSGSVTKTLALTLVVNAVPSSLTYEAETLTYTLNSATYERLTDTAASAGSTVVLRADATGDHIEFTVPNVPAGTYEIRLVYRATTNRGRAVLRVDGTVRGSRLDQYSSTAVYRTHSYGTVTFSSTGNRRLRLTVDGKTAASSDFDLSADAFILIRQP
jgi:hypothetical protein